MAAPLAILLTFLLVGCYTILRHPITEGENPEQAQHQEYYRDRCLECHADYASYPYGFFYGDYPEYFFEYPRFGYYYAYPWWWDRYWYDNTNEDLSPEGEGNGGLAPDRKAARRGGLIPPYVRGSTAIHTGVGGGGVRSPASPGASKGGGTPVTGPASPTVKTQKTRVRRSNDNGDETSTKAKQGKKASRRGGIKP